MCIHKLKGLTIDYVVKVHHVLLLRNYFHVAETSFVKMKSGDGQRIRSALGVLMWGTIHRRIEQTDRQRQVKI